MISKHETEVFDQQMQARRRRGRPVSEKKIPVTPTSVKIPEPVFNALCTIARRERVSLHRLLNTALTSYVAGNFR